MRKILYGGLAAALLLGGAAFAADTPTTQQNQDTSGAASGQAGDTTQSTTHTVGPDKVITNPSAPDRASPMEQKGTAEAPDAMANPAGQNSIQGTIARIHKHKISVTDQSGQKQDFYVNHRSAVLRDGQAVSLKKLKKGDDVRVSYDIKHGKDVATTITATSQGAAGTLDQTDQTGQASPGHNPSGSSIQQPVPANAPPTGENTQPSGSLDDRSFNGNTPGTNYKKESGDQNANTHNAGVNGNIGVQPGQQQGSDPYGRGVNPKEGVKQGSDQQDQTQP